MFKETDINSLQLNPFTKISKDWFLISAGNQESFNAMTGGWGFLGIMWNKPVFEAVIRPDRYTKKLVDNEEYFTIAFFPESCKSALMYCGRHSMNSEPDKMKNCGLTPIFIDGLPCFEEAELILICRKLYVQQMTGDSFIDKKVLETNYQSDDLHYAYFGEIVKAFKK